MKRILLATLLSLTAMVAKAQAPVIEGDTMLCPWTDGTVQVINNPGYDTYQWYYKYWFLSDDFQPIDGATAATFTYDWYTYDQAVFKVEVTQGGNTYESNTIQVDSHAWASMSVIGETEDVEFDPDTESWLICPGDEFPNTVNSPYTANIQWFRNDEPIDGANDATYIINSPGTYYVRASPFMCTQPENEGQSLPIVVMENNDCNLGIDDTETVTKLSLYPNPARNILNIETNTADSTYAIYDLTGKLLLQGTLTTQAVSIEALSSGTYIIKLEGSTTASALFIKE